jgi:antitoxin component of RelBE/YafQ-DinJ toxin-antitoxin module
VLTFPSRAAVGRIMPKEAFYKRLTLSSEIRDKFVADVKRIVMEYKLSPDTINIEKGAEVSEILVLSIELKKQEMDYRILENIARQNAHKLIFLLKFEDQGQLALYYSKLYKTSWMPPTDLKLDARGLNLDDIWNGFIERIAIQEDVPIDDRLSVPEKIKKQDTILKLQKEIEKLERLSRNEKQPKKRFELFTQLQALKKILAEEKGE